MFFLLKGKIGKYIDPGSISTLGEHCGGFLCA
jgi:hypothetical protein